MKKISLVSGLLCTALVFGCGDDKMQMTSGPATMTNPTNATNDTNDTTTDGGSSTSAGSDTTGSSMSGATNPTSTTSPTSGVDTETSGTTGCGSFICMPDGGGGVAPECDAWVQDCPEGQACKPYSSDGDNAWDSLKCSAPIDPNNPGTVGDVCTTEGGGVSGIDSCGKGLMCWNLDMDGNGTCIEMCKGTPDAPMCPAGSSCTIANEGVLILCLPGCDPLIQDCSDTEVCIPNMDNFICVLDASGEEGQEYDACEYANACDPGFLCAGPENDDSGKCDAQAIGCCLAFCDLTAPAPQCTSAQDNPNSLVECVSWYEEGMAPPGYENVGVCIVPA